MSFRYRSEERIGESATGSLLQGLPADIRDAVGVVHDALDALGELAKAHEGALSSLASKSPGELDALGFERRYTDPEGRAVYVLRAGEAEIAVAPGSGAAVYVRGVTVGYNRRSGAHSIVSGTLPGYGELKAVESALELVEEMASGKAPAA